MSDRAHPLTDDLVQAQAIWVRRLAVSLVRDPSTADDVAQEAWLAALRRPPDPGRSAKPWFERVVHNAVRQLARGTVRRARREEIAAREESLPSSHELVERLDVQRRVAEVVAGLEDPYRTVILLRFYEDLEPSEIARRQDLPPSTVRSHLRRGLDQLRERLDGEFGDRRSWCVALIQLAGPGAVVKTGAAASGSGVLQGVLAMSLSLRIAVGVSVLVALLAAVALLQRDPEPRDGPLDLAQAKIEAPPRAQDQSSTPSERRVKGASIPPSSTKKTAPERAQSFDVVIATVAVAEAATSLGAAQTFKVRGSVVDIEGRAVEGIPIGHVPHGDEPAARREALPRPSRVLATSAVDGSFEVEVDSPGILVCADDAHVTVRFAWILNKRAENPIVVAKPTDVSGRVVDAKGHPISAAFVDAAVPDQKLVNLSTPALPFAAPSQPATTDSDGMFHLHGVPDLAETTLEVSAEGYWPRALSLEKPEAGSLEIVLRSNEYPKPRITGRVTDETGDPVADADVSYGNRVVKSDALGKFAIDVNMHGEGIPLVARKAGYQLAVLADCWKLVGERGGLVEGLELKLAKGERSIQGKLVDSKDRPLSGFRILIADATRTVFDEDTYRWGFAELPPPDAQNSVRTNRRGEFRLDGLSARTYRLIAVHEQSFANLESLPIEAGAKGVVLRMPADALGRNLRGRVLAKDGTPIPSVMVSLKVRGWAELEGFSAPERSLGATDEDGRFARDSIPMIGVDVFFMGMDIGWESIDLDGVDTHEEWKITLGRLTQARVDLSASAIDADAFEVRDAKDETVSIDIGWERRQRVDLWQGRSAVVKVSDLATTLVLMKGDRELRRVPIDLRYGELNTLRP